MGLQRIPGSRCVEYRGFEVEIAEGGASDSQAALDGLREDVFSLAARSRGWNHPAALDLFRRKFIIEPLYHVDALALIRKGASLVGMAGAVTNWKVHGKSVVHVCSLGLMPEAQGRGFLPALVVALFSRTLGDSPTTSREGCPEVFVSAITQSPYILEFLNQLVAVYPSPYRSEASKDEREIARVVAARFAPGVHFDTEKFILRRECEFSYRRTPYSRDRQFNRFCDVSLRYDEGDVFVAVGQVIPTRLRDYCQRAGNRVRELLDLLLGERRGGAGEPLAG
jgi:hypothetical protein